MPPPPLLRARRRSPSYTLAPSPAPYTMLRRHALAAAAPAATSCAPPAPPVRLSGLRRRRPCCYPAAEHSRLLCPSCSPAAEHSRLRCEFIGGSDVRSDRNDCSVHSDSDYCPFGDEGEQAAANAGGPAACDFDGYSSEDYSETDLIIDNISDLGKGSHGQSEGPLQVVDLDGLNNQENINLQCEKNQSYEEMIQEHVLKPCQPPRCAVPRVVQKWTPQLAGKVSFNVDVVVFSANSSSDIGVMVREHLGHRLMPCRQSFEDTTSAELAEAQALRCAMVLAREENFHNILVQIICS